MSQRRVQVLLTLAMVNICRAGGDVWEEKDFTQRNEKDIKKVFTNSPWAQPVKLSLSSAGFP